MLQGREVSKLLEPFQQGDDGEAFKEVNGRDFALPGPSLDSRPNSFELEAKAPHWRKVRVVRTNTAPVGTDKRCKRRMGEPGFFHPEDGAPRSFRRGSQMEGGHDQTLAWPKR
jgi:hypothetical protein